MTTTTDYGSKPAAPTDFYTLIKFLMESPDDIDASDFKETELFITLGEDFVRSKIPTFQLSKASKSALKDFLNSEGLTVLVGYLNHLREHKRYMLPALCFILVGNDFRKAIKALPKKPQTDKNDGDIHSNRPTGERKEHVGEFVKAPDW